MKKGKAISLINTASELISIGKQRGVMHLYTDDKYYDGRNIHINNKELINFGSCSYLGLELHPKIKEAAIDAVQRYGSQYSSSRAYVSCTNYLELEGLISKIFNAPTLLSTSSSLGHYAVIPIAIEEGDAVVLDQQVHVSMQEAVQKMQLRNVTVTMIRHSQLNELEQKIEELRETHNKIWYFIDGVYSMYGDFAPLNKIINLLNKHRSLHLYVDDAHGMSWAGKNGSGYTLSQIDLHPRMILATSLAKGFASAGGVFIIPDIKLRDKIKAWGGPLTYSGPQQPAIVGASIASAKIHLSEEIVDLQNDLAKKIAFCNNLIERYNLPVALPSDSPIFYIGLGLVKVGYNMIARLMDDGLYVNIGIFPGVPENRTGIRFTLTCHHTLADIERLVQRIAYHLPKALKDENRTMKDVYRAFRNLIDIKEILPILPSKKEDTLLTVEHFNTIREIPKELWDLYLGDNGTFDWDGMLFFEDVFCNNERPEHNWDFDYFIIRDIKNNPILITFFTTTISKDDFLAPETVSQKIEEKRMDAPYYLSSKTMMMGSLLSNGCHIHIDRSHPEWKNAVILLLDKVWKVQDKKEASILYFRDFDADDIELRDILIDHGLIKIELPDNNVIERLSWKDEKDYYNSFLKSKQRYHLKNDVLKFKDQFILSEAKSPDRIDVEKWYELYKNVKAKNFLINDFTLPKKLFDKMAIHPKWKVTLLELAAPSERPLVGVGFSYLSENGYSPVMLGLDYNFSQYKPYKQLLYNFVMDAKKHEKQRLFFGFTASLEKRKLGAKAIPQVAYLQVKDDFNRALMSTYTDTN